MFSITSARYFLYLEPTDMRKSFDGLCGPVTSKLGQNPMSGDLYIFVNKPRRRIMVMWPSPFRSSKPSSPISPSQRHSA